MARFACIMLSSVRRCDLWHATVLGPLVSVLRCSVVVEGFETGEQ